MFRSCEFLVLDSCLVAEQLLGDAVGQSCQCSAGPDACRACLETDNPRGLNRVTASLATAGAREIGQAAQVAAQYREVLRGGPVSEPPPCPPDGPGTELHGLLKTVGLDYEPGCKCEQTACEMNRQGPEWCEQNLELIVGRMKHEANRRRLPFFKPAARQLVRLAIRRARRAGGVQELREITDGGTQQTGG